MIFKNIYVYNLYLQKSLNLNFTMYISTILT